MNLLSASCSSIAFLTIELLSDLWLDLLQHNAWFYFRLDKINFTRDRQRVNERNAFLNMAILKLFSWCDIAIIMNTTKLEIQPDRFILKYDFSDMV